jgi:excisionase family DNA binding protein
MSRWFQYPHSFNNDLGAPMQSKYSEPATIAYSIKEAAKVSSLGRTSIYNHIKSGKLRAVRIGGRTVIPAESLHALIAGEA